MATHVLGIDIGGTGIKGAPVDLSVGEFAGERHRIPTPQSSTPEAVADVVVQIAEHFADQIDGTAAIGITFPGIVSKGKIRLTANIDKSWMGVDADGLFTEKLGRPVHVVNDGDAAGVAEMEYGAGQGVSGVVLMTTLGTGIGSALFTDGELVPNTELGHLELDGHDAETRAANSVREREELSWKKWAQRLQRYYEHVEMLFSPDLIIIGGGVSKKSERFLHRIELDTPIVPAQLLNAAGIVGAARYAQRIG